MSEPSAAPDATQRFFGGLLMAVGGLIATLCGLCSLFALVFVIPAAFTTNSNFGGPGIFLLWLISGLLPTTIGAFLFWLGWRLYSPRRKPPDVAR